MASNPDQALAVDAIAGLTRVGEALRTLGEHHGVVLVPEGTKVQDLRPLMPPPPWVTQVVVFDEADSFVDYVQHYRLPQSAVFVREDAFRAYIDYHQHANARGRCEHVASFKACLSLEAEAWLAQNGKLLEQDVFSRFLEENLMDIVAPAPASMLEVALNLEVKKAATFSSQLRLENGTHQFRYDEVVRGSTRGGDLVIPDTFRIAIPIHKGGDLVQVDARLRYRLSEGQLRIGYELAQWRRVIDTERRQLRAAISAKLGEDLPIYAGWA